MLDKNITYLNKIYYELINSDFVEFDSIKKLKNIMGVYIIYSPLDEIIYIGSTNKFHVRFGTDLRHESTHTLVKKLIKDGSYSERKLAYSYLSQKCKFRKIPCNSKREAEALEHFAIWVLNPKYNK